MKKIRIVLILIILILINCNISFAESEMQIISDKLVIEQGEEVGITINIKNYTIENV